MEIKVKSIIDFDALFEEYNSYVFKIVINESNNSLTKEDIEETVSDVFFLLWKNRKKIKDYSKVKSYIAAIARNATKNKLRTADKNISFDDNIFETSNDIELSFSTNEQLKLIQDALQEVETIDKKIFIMYYYENKKIKEIAILENMNISATKTRLHRTRKKLKKLLEKGGLKNER